MFGEQTQLWNKNHVGNEDNDGPSDDFSTFNGTGTGHGA